MTTQKISQMTQTTADPNTDAVEISRDNGNGTFSTFQAPVSSLSSGGAETGDVVTSLRANDVSADFLRLDGYDYLRTDYPTISDFMSFGNSYDMTQVSVDSSTILMPDEIGLKRNFSISEPDLGMFSYCATNEADIKSSVDNSLILDIHLELGSPSNAEYNQVMFLNSARKAFVVGEIDNFAQDTSGMQLFDLDTLEPEESSIYRTAFDSAFPGFNGAGTDGFRIASVHKDRSESRFCMAYQDNNAGATSTAEYLFLNVFSGVNFKLDIEAQTVAGFNYNVLSNERTSRVVMSPDGKYSAIHIGAFGEPTGGPEVTHIIIDNESQSFVSVNKVLANEDNFSNINARRCVSCGNTYTVFGDPNHGVGTHRIFVYENATGNQVTGSPIDISADNGGGFDEADSGINSVELLNSEVGFLISIGPDRVGSVSAIGYISMSDFSDRTYYDTEDFSNMAVSEVDGVVYAPTRSGGGTAVHKMDMGGFGVHETSLNTIKAEKIDVSSRYNGKIKA